MGSQSTKPDLVTRCWASTCASGHTGKGRNGKKSLQAGSLWGHALNHSGREQRNCVALIRLSRNPCLLAAEVCLFTLFSEFLRCNVLRNILLPGAGMSNKYRQAESWTAPRRSGGPLTPGKRRHCLPPSSVLLLPSWLLAKKQSPGSLPLTFTHGGHPTGHITGHSHPGAPGRASPPSWESSPPLQALLIDVPNT